MYAAAVSALLATMSFSFVQHPTSIKIHVESLHSSAATPSAQRLKTIIL